MSAGRDDFVIAIRSAFLKRENKQKFSLSGLLLFSIFLILLSKFNIKAVDYLRSGINEGVYRLSFIASIPEQEIKKTSILIQNHFNMYEEYSELKKDYIDLKGKQFNVDYLQSENKRLKKIIDEYITDSNKVVAKVLIDKNSPFLKSIILNKGSKENIKLGTAVLDGEYLIGKIVEVNYSTSRALLISDLNSKIPVIIEPNSILSILSGSGKTYGQIQYTKDESDLSIGSIVYTSGSGGIFKSGIPIGKIIFDRNTNSKIVDFFTDLNQLTFVKLITFEKDLQK
ncbi:MAG: rod shape-determining protein MreC [Candidatus Pelagibacter sp.]|tara:strand:- start:524 stop:1375 length:852 start_codon:yes stop_codon:yes gene_type:complete